METNYKSWFSKYKNHISPPISQELSKTLLTKGFPKYMWGMSNKQEYKQIKVVAEKGLLVLTSMAGQAIKIFSLDNFDSSENQPQSGVVPIFEKHYKQKVVEVEISPDNKYAFFTLSDFGKLGLKDRLVCLNLNSFKTVFDIETKGQWSKYIAYHPAKLLVVSNWHSNDLSVIDIKNLRQPKIAQIIPCGLSPRGVSFDKTGNLGIVCGYYSRNLTFLRYNSTDRKFYIEKITEPFDFPNYSGNMRHVVFDELHGQAFVSNMGRNLVHKVDLAKQEISDSFPVASFPNTIRISQDGKYLAVSCRESDIVCILNTRDGRIEALVDTGPEPTGLDFIQTDILGAYDLYITNFADDSVLCKRVVLE